MPDSSSFHIEEMPDSPSLILPEKCLVLPPSPEPECLRVLVLHTMTGQWAWLTR